MGDEMFNITGGICDNIEDMNMIFEIFDDDELYELFGIQFDDDSED